MPRGSPTGTLSAAGDASVPKASHHSWPRTAGEMDHARARTLNGHRVASRAGANADDACAECARRCLASCSDAAAVTESVASP